MPAGSGGGGNLSAGQIATMGAAGLAGAFPQTTTQTQSGTGTQNTIGEVNTSQSSNASSQLNSLLQLLNTLRSSGTSTTTPNLSPATQALIDRLTSSYSQFARPVDLSGYQAQQTQGINRNADLASQAVNSVMAARGLASSPVAGTAQAQTEAGRIGAITNLNESLPVLQNQLTLQNLNAGANYMNMIPHGTTTTQSQEQTQEQQQQMQQFAQNWANQFGYQSNQQSVHNENQQQNKTTSGGGVGGAVSGIAAVLAAIFSDKRLKKEVKTLPTDKAVERIMALRPVSWKWRDSEVEDTGLIAQELEHVMPELVDKNESGIRKVNYAGLIGTIVSAVQAINNKVEASA